MVVGPELVNVGGGTFKLNELPTLVTEATGAAVVVITTVGVIPGEVFVITEPEVILIPVPLVYVGDTGSVTEVMAVP